MTDIGRTFDVASEERLIDLINKARRRLVIICPALRETVAKALADRLDQGFDGATVILDDDPEVYRLGFGTEAGLDLLRAASDRTLLDLRVQSGVRIGVFISDETTMVFSPAPLLIEAGSTSVTKPNAIVLSGEPVERLIEAAGAGTTEKPQRQEIGAEAFTPAVATALKADLKANPPQPFDVSRAVRVFNSKVQYVEIQAENYRISSRQIRLPPELIDIADDQLRDQISTRLRAPAEALGPFDIVVERENGQLQLKADEKWIRSERKRVEDQYTYQIPRYGRVIFTRDREVFDKEIGRFTRNLDKYCQAARAAFKTIETAFADRLVNEFLPKWQQNPPRNFAEHGIEPTDDVMKQELNSIAHQLAQEAISFETPEVRIVYKSISPESVRQAEFLNPLLKGMRRRRVPIAVIESLFSAGDAAPPTTGFTKILA